MVYELDDDIIRAEIETEFDSLQSVNYDQPKSYGYAMDVFKQPYGESRDFSLVYKSGGTIFNMQREDAVIEVIKRLINLDNYEQVLKDVEISESTLVKIIKLFVKECEKRNIECPLNLTLIAPKGLGKVTILRGLKRLNVKLNYSSVRFIRRALDVGNSTYRIASIFHVSPSTIFQIKAGLTWRDKGKNDICKSLGTEEECRDYLKQARWNGSPVCLYCEYDRIYSFSDGKTLRCARCKKKFNVTKGTIFENSNIPLQIWFYAIYLLNKHDLSSIKLSNRLGVTQKSAWSMIKRINTSDNMNWFERSQQFN